jgi:hypothetical protein
VRLSLSLSSKNNKFVQYFLGPKVSMSQQHTEPPQASCPRNDLLCAEGLKDAALNIGRIDKFGIAALPQFFSDMYPDKRQRSTTTPMACGGSYSGSSSSASGAMSAGFAVPDKDQANFNRINNPTLKQQAMQDYSQLKRDWMRLRTQNKVVVGVAAGLGAAALITVVILAIMLARKR